MNRNITIRQEVALKNIHIIIKDLIDGITIIDREELDETLIDLENAFPYVDFETLKY